jgi:hypothetical protein
MSIYNLESGPFGLCSGYWDKNDEVFRQATPTEKGECCINVCRPFVKKCRELCHKSTTLDILKSCNIKCDKMEDICEDNCQLSSKLWGKNNPVYKASDEFGCGNSFETPINKECVIKNRNEILRECNNKCASTGITDCHEHCEYSYGLISEETKNPLDIGKNLETSQNLKDLQNVKSTYNDSLYVLYSFALAIILFGFYIIFTLHKK